MSPVWQLTGFVSTALLLLAIGQLQRRSYFRPYPFLSLYLLAQLFVTFAQWGQLMSLYSVSNEGYKRLYWTTEFATEFLLATVMISFIYRALEGTEHRWRTVALVTAIVIASGALTLVLSGTAVMGSNRFSSLLARNVSFGSALLNVFLWQSLLKYRRNDVQLLLLSLGAGLWTTGRAIGQSLRLIGLGSQLVGDGTLVITEVLCLFIWFWALSRFRVAQPAAPASVQPTTPA